MTTAVGVRRRATLNYLGMSLLTGFVELGVVLLAARSGWSLVSVVGLGLSYQVGALLVRPVSLGDTASRVALAAAAITTAASGVFPGWTYLATALCAVGLQGLRDRQLIATDVATLPKRIARIGGFLAASVFVWWLVAVVALAVLLIDVSSPGIPASARGVVKVRADRFSVLMVIHQSHYFTYCYALLFLIANLYHSSAIAAAAVFAAGWVTYTLAPVLLRRLPTLPLLVAGHLVVVVVMLTISGTLGDRDTVTIAWVLSGLGGGTVFCIKLLALRAGEGHEMESWENVGHVAGALFAVILARVGSIEVVFVAAAALAGGTAALGWWAATATRTQTRQVMARL